MSTDDSSVADRGSALTEGLGVVNGEETCGCTAKPRVTRTG